jgi:hypothetical protein
LLFHPLCEAASSHLIRIRFLHHARSLLGASEGVNHEAHAVPACWLGRVTPVLQAEPCHVKFPCRIRSSNELVMEVEFDLHLLR